MLKKRSTKLLCLLIAFIWTTVIVGSSYAYFIDSVTMTGNVVAAGNLKAGLEYKDKNGDWKDASEGAIFDYQRWEPGYTDVKYIKVNNKGNLAFQYELNVFPAELLTGSANLMDVLEVYYGEGVTGVTRENYATELTYVGTLMELLDGTKHPNGAAYGILLPEEGKGSKDVSLPAGVTAPKGSVEACMVLHMRETAGNEYQNLSVGEGFTVQLAATQYMYENDSFGNTYDQEAELPVLNIPTSMIIEVTPVNGQVPYDVWFNDPANGVSATVPAGAKMADGATALKLVVEAKKSSEANVSLSKEEELFAYNVKVEGLAADNTVPVVINMGEVLPNGLNLGNYSLYHVENGTTHKMTLVDSAAALDAHNEFTYDPVNGAVAVAMATFSEVALVADTENAWNGTLKYDWYDANKTELTIANADQLAGFGAIVGGMAKDESENAIAQDSFKNKTVKLIADVNLGDAEENNDADKIFYPIGYYYNGDSSAPSSTVNSFEGTFDGNGHTISNFYQNTWEIKGDYDGNYYSDAMGLFGYVVNGTIKNLTVDNFSSDGEFTPTGVIAAYAVNSTFENIAITNCNPRVYNTGNGGIVGIGGNSDDPDEYKLTFTNITIDNTNKISALWGSWDVACGGLVGMFRGAGHVHMTNCHVAAQMDVYNDVCGNYQYYWYRYAGMMVGTNKNMVTDDDGYTVPETSKFHAENCTVHFGEWNDYYYCELVANSLASYTHDHQFSRLEQISSLDEIKSGDTWTKEGNFLLISGNTKTCYHIVNKNGNLIQHLHTDAGEETVGGETVLKEDKQIVYLPFNQLFTGYGWGVKHIPVYNGENYAFEGITILDREVADSVVKFEKKFTNTNFMYRVGNANAVTLGSLFSDNKTEVDIIDKNVYVTIDKVDENSNVSGKFTANTSDWTKGTIQFSGTGVVKITIQDYNFCTPTTLLLEVVDAVNATAATNATAKNVVLLNDCGFSSFEVSGGYTLYGNGFTMKCSSDSAALDMGYSFVTLNNGTLDNVQIVCPNFDYAALYKSNLTNDGNRNETDANGNKRYYNARSGVMVSGNSQILNSRISGGRAAVNVSGGNVVIDNSRIELGAVASVLVGAANSLTLRDVTLVQKPTVSTHDSSKTLMGFSVLYLCDSEGKATPTTLEGSFVQQAWIDEGDAQYVPSAGESIVTSVLQETDYLHDIDGDGTNESLNLGFAYMPEELNSSVTEPTNIADNRTDKATIPYEMKDVSVQLAITSTTVYVYSYKNTNGTDDSFMTESTYVPNKYSDIITVNYSDTAEGLTTGKSYGTDGWVYELNVDLDKLSGYALDFSKLSMSVNGVPVTDFKVDGEAKPTSPAEVTAGGTTYKLTATIDGKEYTANYKVTGTETSKESPSLVAANYEAGLCVASSYGGTWHGAAPALEGIQIKYWSVAEKQYKTISLSDYTPTTPGKLNGTNTTWTYSPANGDFTLTLTGGQVHSSNSVYAMPVVVDHGTESTPQYKLYFVAAASNGLVNSGNSARTIPVTYTFEDNNNGDVLTFSHTWSVTENKNEQYKYSDFCDGTLTKLEAGSNSGGGSCVTPDTLITLADGTQVRVDSLTGNEKLLVWNMETGMLDEADIMFVDNDPEAEYEIIHLYFSDGTDVKVIYEHGFWDYDLNKYVYLDRNAEKYIGHTFAKHNGNELSKVKLTDVVIEKEVTTAWSPVTADHLCYFVNGMLSMPGGVGGLFNIFDVDSATMAYDMEALARDIETYGLFTYEELNAIVELPEEMFNAAGGAYLKVSIGKGNLTMDELIYMIERYTKYFK